MIFNVFLILLIFPIFSGKLCNRIDIFPTPETSLLGLRFGIYSGLGFFLRTEKYQRAYEEKGQKMRVKIQTH